MPNAAGESVDVAETEVRAPGGGRRYVIAWYDLNGRIVARAYEVKLLAVWNAVLHRRSNGAVVALTLDAPPSLNAQRALGPAAVRDRRHSRHSPFPGDGKVVR